MALQIERKLGQSLIIADCVEITVLEIHHRKVRLAITYPHGMLVERKEVTILRRKREAKARERHDIPA